MNAKIIRAGLAALATATVLLSGCGDAVSAVVGR
ncbi:hypothetical protein BC793_1053 [Actinoplanes xinjiangensis]|jgi:hypothetical protein|uniref:Uncharacterized protein n=1 Tax=Actinoplanes xinjiangensis TaxID=512350 RepID=A0A316FJI1_9ACTN|nr:hypothetical protein BC793_1053 [Actinoplanes xinjiangensis]